LQLLAFRSTDKANLNRRVRPHQREVNFTIVLDNFQPTEFNLAHGLAKQMTRTKSAKEYFEYDRRFWSILFEKAQRPILWEVFRQLDDRLTRYNPLVLKLFPDPAASALHAASVYTLTPEPT
jgi:hypothetical protein